LVWSTHVPVPSHTLPLTEPALHVVGPQLVPKAAFAHSAALPLHAATSPQTLEESTTHLLLGFVPCFATSQVPELVPDCLLDAAQAMHVWSQAVLQQTPSAQKPELHTLAAEQDWPFASLATQLPPEQ